MVFMNGIAEVLTGWHGQDAVGRSLHKVFHIVNEETRQPVESPVDKVRRTGTVVGLANHTVLLRRDGSEVAIDDSGAPIFEPDQAGQEQLVGIVLIFRDITERRRAERNLELLAASGAALSSSLDVSSTLQRIAELSIQTFSDFCYFDLLDADGNLQRTTRKHRDPRHQALLERASRAQPLPRDKQHPVMQAIGDNEPRLVRVVTDEWRQQIALSAEHLDAIRELNFHSLLSVPLASGGKPLGALSFCRVTQPHAFDDDDVRVGEELGRRVSEAIMNGRLYQTLALREESLQLALEAGQIGIWEFFPLTRKLVWSPRVREIFGVSAFEEIDIQRNFDLLHPDDRTRTSAVMQAALDPGGTGEYSTEFRVVRPSGEIRHVAATGRAFFEQSPASSTTSMVATRFTGMVHDVTEARVAEASLRAREARFRDLIENASVGIMIGDLQGGITYMNPALQRLLGYDEAKIRRGDVRWDQISPAEFAERDQEAVQQLQETGTCIPYEKAFLNTEGVPVPLLLGATMIAGETAQQDVAVFVTDLTALRQTESALRESEKLAAVGRLAGSIAHEINNPLEAVTNLLYLLNTEVTTLALKQLVATAQEELSRVSHIVTHTLRFHRQATRPTLTSVRSLLESTLVLYRGRLRNAEVNVSTRYREAPELLCYEGEIRQVLANLVSNALDATPRGGRLELRERQATDWKTGRDGIMLTVADTGSGMSEDTLRNIFKAFFTTKGIGGTGLGLWISEEILRKHGGRMKVRSRMAERGASGTVFMVWLPYATDAELKSGA